MATGTVKWFNDSKGFGFITPSEGGEDLFAHHTAIQMSGFKTLKEGQKVEFEVKRGPKGLQAAQHQAALTRPHDAERKAAFGRPFSFLRTTARGLLGHAVAERGRRVGDDHPRPRRRRAAGQQNADDQEAALHWQRCRLSESNRRPTAYKAVALPLS